MADHTIEISCTGPTPTDTNASGGDRVGFHNTTGADTTITLSGSGAFNPSPGNSFDVGNNATVWKTVGNAKGEIDFSYPDCGGELGTRNGKIIVN